MIHLQQWGFSSQQIHTKCGCPIKVQDAIYERPRPNNINMFKAFGGYTNRSMFKSKSIERNLVIISIRGNIYQKKVLKNDDFRG